MAVFTEESARANIRTRDGKRVFYLADGDLLTPSARQWLKRERIEVLPASVAKPQVYRTLQGAVLAEKPEHMTHLQADLLVPKDHPRIVLRGQIDLLETELLLTIRQIRNAGDGRNAAFLEEILRFVRNLIRWEVLHEPVQQERLCGLTMEELREHSHVPQKYYGIPHFMPEADDSETILLLNRLRALVRGVELAAYRAFRDQDGNVTRPDLIQALNRLSSLFWILMIRKKKEEQNGEQT